MHMTESEILDPKIMYPILIAIPASLTALLGYIVWRVKKADEKYYASRAEK